jgi:hypothetical protein
MVLHGLLFSGAASSALSPFEVTAFEEGSALRTRANVSAIFLVIVCFVLSGVRAGV